MRMRRKLLVGVLTISLDANAIRAAETLPDVVEFNRDLRPILSDICFQCHGPDANQRKADLRLDQEAGLYANRDGHRIITPGKPDASELFLRLVSDDDSERMPPAKSGKKLTAQQIDLVRRWIEQGAKWQGHWSFLPPKRPTVPEVRSPKAEIRNPIDNFVLARLDREGLSPSPPADRVTLIRRVTLDLTGLPPTPAEVDAFVADPSPDAYEKVVDRLLASSRYGERMAARWLDAARYADTHGYQTDGERHMWRWRDWVIDAFNSNLPFDRFTIEQLAGDLLPDATLDQRIATGFNRNHRGNSEGGIIPEEYAVEYVVDRVETTGTVWLGLTLGCGRCHDHKYDPVTQREFYQLFAFFNNVPEKGRAVKYGNSPPYIQAPTREQQRQLGELEKKYAAAEAKLRLLDAELTFALGLWERSPPSPLPAWSLTDGLLVQASLDDLSVVAEPFTHDLAPPYGGVVNLDDLRRAGGVSPRVERPGENNLRDPVPRTPDQPDNRVIAAHDGDPDFVSGRIGRAGRFDGRRVLDAGDVADFGFYDKFTLAAWVWPDEGHGGTILSRMTDAPRGDGYALVLDGGKVQLNLVKRWLDDSLRVETERRLEPNRWHHIAATYDGSREANGVQIYIDGNPQPLRIVLDELNQSFATKEPLRIGGGGGPDGRFRGLIDDVRVYRRVVTADEAVILATPDSLADILPITLEHRTPAQRLKLRFAFREHFAPEEIRAAYRDLIELRRQRDTFVERLPTVMVMEELPKPRDTRILIRGQYDKPGEPVSPGLPVSLTGGTPVAGIRNRLDFARWLVSPDNPLTARVTVNRLWQMLFGSGLVKTVDDFGSQGEWPTHPELLDWLACEFMESRESRVENRGDDTVIAAQLAVPRWNIKRLLRLIVTSATYRQDSRIRRSEARAGPDAGLSPLVSRLSTVSDPDNRWLARGPRGRLSAEAIRDQALFASGLLIERLGGPSVMPYQPPGLWEELTGQSAPVEHGESLYRRSLYTFWKRTVAPPTMMTFDASGREMCLVRETRTNTPLQALTLLNEVTFVEAARKLAERVLREAGPTPAEQLTLAYRLLTSRKPRPAELDVLARGLATHLAHFRAHRQAALDLLKSGESPRDESLDPAEVAAYAAIAGLILNLDETITKE